MKNPERVDQLLAELRELADTDFERHRIDVLERDLIAPPQVEQIDDKHQLNCHIQSPFQFRKTVDMFLSYDFHPKCIHQFSCLTAFLIDLFGMAIQVCQFRIAIIPFQ